MNIRSISLTLFLAILLSGCGGGSGEETTSTSAPVFPEESFAVFDGTSENKLPMVGSFNQAYQNYEYKESYPWRLYIAIGLDQVDDNMLPSQEESRVAYNLEDKFLADIKTLTGTHYIGHVFVDGFLDIYMYVDDPQPVRQYLQTAIDEESTPRPFGFEIVEDPQWQTVAGFLK